ncbi:MAG TPA: MSMEG_6728 family protein [Ktedonobacteraceae bacterium]|nr:MSMEG_6728 family protein [Ktedonobacteraceae bacterium]
MQTFLPCASFEETARILDYRRLGKQRVEGLQILNIIATPEYAGSWMNHPAVKMWRGYDMALKLYVNTMIEEWKRRGYRNTIQYYDIRPDELVYPWWFGDTAFHDSHKSNLLRKYPEYYRQFGWDVPDDLPYVWPV